MKLDREEEIEMVEIVAQMRGVPTADAFRLYDGKVNRWVPRSLVTDNGDGTFTMPMFLAKEKEFI